eukprot:3220961-Prymnesium_polylepis.1
MALLRQKAGTRALIAAERRGNAWDVFLDALCCAGLPFTDLSDDLHASLHEPDCPFWCAKEAIGRLHLLEIRLSPKADDVRSS